MSGPGPEQRGSFFDALRRRATPAEANGVMVPRGLRVATAYAWRLLVIAAGVGVAIWLVIQLKLLIIPLLIAILVSALLWPAFSWMLRHRWPRWLAIGVSVIGALAIVTGLPWVAVWQIPRERGAVRDRTVAAVQQPRP